MLFRSMSDVLRNGLVSFLFPLSKHMKLVYVYQRCQPGYYLVLDPGGIHWYPSTPASHLGQSLFSHRHNLEHCRVLEVQLFDCRTTSQNWKLLPAEWGASCELIHWRINTSQGQNKPRPCSHVAPQQMDHLVR